MTTFDPLSFSQALDRADWSVVFGARQQGIPWAQLVNEQGFQALHLAVLWEDPLIVSNLLLRGAPTQGYATHDGIQRSLLWDAIWRDQDGIATALIEAGANLDEADPNPRHTGEHPLVVASQRYLARTTQALLEYGVNLRHLSVPQRAQVFEAWFDAQATPEPAARTQADSVLQALANTGWFPEGEEAEALGERLLDTSATEALHRLLACWRERQGGLVSRTVPPATHRRNRS